MSSIDIAGVERAFLVRNPYLEQLLFDRGLAGLDFTTTCENASACFLELFKDELGPLLSDIAELMLLSKGLYFWLHNAFARVFESNLECNFVATSRSKIDGNEARIEVPYCNFDAPAHNLIIADVVATGSSVCAALERYLERYRLDRLYVFTVAGTASGGRVIGEFCQQRGIQFSIAYGLAAFGLADNGFDLSFLNPDTVTYDEYRDRASHVFRGRPVSSIGWDFGSQAQSRRKYGMLSWIEAEYWELQNSDVFPIQEAPVDRDLVSKERAAYAERFPNLDRLIEK